MAQSQNDQSSFAPWLLQQPGQQLPVPGAVPPMSTGSPTPKAQTGGAPPALSTSQTPPPAPPPLNGPPSGLLGAAANQFAGKPAGIPQLHSPLLTGAAPNIIQQNIQTLVASGMPEAQAIAAALAQSKGVTSSSALPSGLLGTASTAMAEKLK